MGRVRRPPRLDHRVRRGRDVGACRPRRVAPRVRQSRMTARRRSLLGLAALGALLCVGSASAAVTLNLPGDIVAEAQGPSGAEITYTASVNAGPTGRAPRNQPATVLVERRASRPSPSRRSFHSGRRPSPALRMTRSTVWRKAPSPCSCRTPLRRSSLRRETRPSRLRGLPATWWSIPPRVRWTSSTVHSLQRARLLPDRSFRWELRR